MKKSTSTRRPRIVPFELPTDWTPKQALAIFNLLDALSHKIWLHYEAHLISAMLDQNQPFTGIPDPSRWLPPKPNGNPDDDFPDDDIPF
jgi:hypothetical protein